MAKAMHDPKAKFIMRELAVGYLDLAERAAARERQKSHAAEMPLGVSEKPAE